MAALIARCWWLPATLLAIVPLPVVAEPLVVQHDMAAPKTADLVARWESWIAEASDRFGVPTSWIARVMDAESGGRTHLRGGPIVSRAGAMGLMQLMPGTWRAMRREHRLGADPHDPHDNILAGAAYLRAMYDRFGYPGLFGAYNAGPDRYAAYLDRGLPLPKETWVYLAKTAGSHRPAAAPRSVPAPDLFAIAERGSQRSAMLGVPPPSGRSLFYALTARSEGTRALY